MPFTFSHPAIVLPFNHLSKHRVSLTALVIGSMVPDFEYFIRIRVLSHYSHTLAGLFWFDLPLGLILMWIYNSLVKDKLIGHLPPYLNKRFSCFKNSDSLHTNPKLNVVIVSLLIGTASHLLWDSFTHPAGYFVKHIHLLRYPIIFGGHTVKLFNILQHVSSLAGAAIIFCAIKKLPEKESTLHQNTLFFWAKVILVMVLVLLVRIFTGLNPHQYGNLIVTAISGMFIGLVFASVATAKQHPI